MLSIIWRIMDIEEGIEILTRVFSKRQTANVRLELTIFELRNKQIETEK